MYNNSLLYSSETNVSFSSSSSSFNSFSSTISCFWLDFSDFSKFIKIKKICYFPSGFVICFANNLFIAFKSVNQKEMLEKGFLYFIMNFKIKLCMINFNDTNKIQPMKHNFF